jgi:hypothetical protein
MTPMALPSRNCARSIRCKGSSTVPWPRGSGRLVSIRVPYSRPSLARHWLLPCPVWRARSDDGSECRGRCCGGALDGKRVLLGYTHHSADGGKRMVWHELSSGKFASQAHAAVMPVAGETMGVGFSAGVWSGEGWPVRRSPQAPPPSH